jgi:hypothetical protein
VKKRLELTLLALVLGTTGPALAWDPATTHAGLTERALSASKFHATLAQQLGRPLGGFEPLRLSASVLDADVARTLKARLGQLDPAGGFQLGEGSASAIAWVEAGAVLAKTPPERGRHHFLEPGKRQGLDDGPGLSGELHATRLTLDDGATVRDAATGMAFALEGMSALDWLWSPRNDLGLAAFLDHWERAASAAQAIDRETALVRGLLALGGSLAILEDMGQPAFVRNDFRGEFLSESTGSALERFVADRYGAVALPPASVPVARPDIESYFVAADGKGLAQRTQERFFSAGTLPADAPYAPEQAAAELVRWVNQSLPFPAPAVAGLDVRQAGITRYVQSDGVRVLAYRRDGERIHFFLDRAVHGDCARRWLPEIEGYAAGLINHLLRVQLELSVAEQKVSIVASGLSGHAEAGMKLHVLAEDADGGRKQFAEAPFSTDSMGPFAVPAGTRKVVSYVRGRDFVAVSEMVIP